MQKIMNIDNPVNNRRQVYIKDK